MPIINNLTGAEIEITKLADILTGTDYDITDVYYGDLHIFTVWGESEGALPRTFNANGDNAVEWQVFGGVDPNANLFDVNRAYSSTWTLNTSSYMIAAATVSQVYPDNAQVTINNDGSITVTSYDNGYGALFLINAEPNKTYTLSFDVSKQSSGSYAAITSRKQNGDIIPDSHATSSNTSITYTTPNDTAYIAICLRVPASDGEVTYSNVMVVKGSTVPSTYVPYTDKMYCGVRTENLFDKETAVQGSYIRYNDEIVVSNEWAYSDYIPVLPETHYFFMNAGRDDSNVVFYDINKTNIGYLTQGDFNQATTTKTPNRCAYIRFNLLKVNISACMMMKTTRSQYIPYGYKIPVAVGDGNTSTLLPLYIGDSQLQPDEYTSYKDQKIYKYVSGVLTPTDPPVPIPALPTLNGVTVVDTELASSDVQPEKAFVKFRKMNS